MAVNIGPQIGITGEKEYRKQINDLITQQKTFSAEMKELESSFDDSTSAMEKNRKKAKLLGQAINNQEKQVSELEKGLEASKKKYGENSTETQKWKQAVANAKTELNKMQTELKKIPSSLATVGKGMQDVGKKMQSIGGNLSKYVTAPLAGIGAASIAAFNEVDAGMDIVAIKSGATGEALESLQTSAKNLATTIPVSFETAGDAIGEVNTRFGVTGEELETLSGKFVKFAEINGTDVSSSVDKVQKVMAAFGLETEDAGQLLDALNKAGQDTGISMDTLESSMLKNATALQQMGLDAYDAAAFLGSVETSGVDTSVVMTGLSKALTEAAKDGKTLPEALAEFQDIMSSSASEQDKLTAATELFGKKAGPAIYEACKQGSLSFESLSNDAAEYMGSVDTTFDAVQDAPDKFAVAMNKVKVAGSEIGGTLLEMAVPAIDALGNAASKAGDWFDSLTKEQQNVVAYSAVFAAGLGPAITVLGKVTETAGLAVSQIATLGEKAATIGGVGGTVALAAGGLALLGAALESGRKATLNGNATLQEILPEITSASSELSTAIESLATVSDTANAAIDDINAKASTADSLIDELYQLEKQSDKTAEEQARMKTIVSELNKMYPSLGLSIDKATGKLNKGKTAVKGYVQSAKDLALIDAYAAAASDTITELAKSTMAYNKALQAQETGQKGILQLQAELNKAIAESQIDTSNSGYWDELTQTWRVLTPEIIEAEEALKVAKEEQEGLNAAVDSASEVMSAAESDYNAYVKAQEDLQGSTETTTEAMEASTEAAEAASGAYNGASKALAEMVSADLNAAANILASADEEIKAYDDLYQAAYDSIKGQIGLFDEWSQESELTAEDMLKNMQTQTEGLANYATNLETLTKMAAESGDENFKAFVQSIAEMGIKGAGELQVLVDAAENDKETFNEIIGQFGQNDQYEKNIAELNATIENGFVSKGDIVAKNFNNALSAIANSKTVSSIKTGIKSLGDNIKKQSKDITKQTATDSSNNSKYIQYAWEQGYGKLPQIARTATNKTVSETKTSINGMQLKPSVSEIAVPPLTTDTAKERIKSGLSNIPGSVGKLTGALQAGKTAADEAASKMNVTGKVTDITGAKDAAKSAAITASENLKVSAKMEISNVTSAALNAKEEFKRTVGTIWVKMAATNQNVDDRMATGGYINEESVILAGEGNKSEVIIPLEANRSRALQLYEETGRILGASSLQQSATATLPAASQAIRNGQTIQNFDADKMYAAVAAGAEKGMENANIRIYWNNREAGRIMRDMGVVFV